MNIAIGLLSLMFISAAGFVVVGVHMLVGLPWALIAIGVLLFGAAIFLRSGLTPNG